jgi:hypothetical protein
LKTAKDQLINLYYKGKEVRYLCHITDSIYFLGFKYDGLIVWDQEKDEELFRISQDWAF